jgi:hypothetical protein
LCLEYNDFVFKLPVTQMEVGLPPLTQVKFKLLIVLRQLRLGDHPTPLALEVHAELDSFEVKVKLYTQPDSESDLSVGVG